MAAYLTSNDVEDRDYEGFSLIELMVVLLIISILIAIAIPTFLGSEGSANARAAQSNVRNALTAQIVSYSYSQAYSASLASLAANEPAIPWGGTTGAAGSPASWTANTVYVGTGTASGRSEVLLGALGKDRNCYWALEQAGGTFYGYTTSGNATACTTPTTWFAAWNSTTTATPATVGTLTAAS